MVKKFGMSFVVGLASAYAFAVLNRKFGALPGLR